MSQPRADRRYTTSADDDAAVDWRTSAACLDIDPELFFPVQSAPERAEPAKHVCRRCPAVRACLSEALTHDVTGVWGGTTFAEREQIRTEHGITAASILSRLPVDSPALMVDHMTGGVLGEGDRRTHRHDPADCRPLPHPDQRRASQ